MALIIREALQIQQKDSPFHTYKTIYLKIAMVFITLATRFIHPYAMLTILITNIILLLHIGIRRILLASFVLWCIFSLIIITIDLMLSTLTVDVVYNLIYGFTTFTALIFFYTTTSPKHIRMFLGTNILSLSYLYLNYSIKLVIDLLDVLRARGWNYTINLYRYKYLLRAFATLLIVKISESVDALKARGVEE